MGFFLAAYAMAATGWAPRVSLIEKKLMDALSFYQKGDIKQAKKLCDDAYFGVFEDINANMEVAIRVSVSQKKAAELEEGFGSIRKSFIAKKTDKEILSTIQNLVSQIHETAKELDNQKVALK